MSVRLTQSFVDSVKPTEKVVNYACNKRTGFVLRVYPSGKRVYVMRYTQDGRQDALVLGDVLEMSLVRAHELWEDKRYALRQGKEMKARVVPLLLRDAIKEWFVEHRTTLKQNTILSYQGKIDRQIIPKLGRKDIRRITKRDVRSWHRELGTTPQTANHAAMVLSAFYKWAVNIAEYADKNPVSGIKLHPVKKRKRFLSPDEETRLLDALREYDNQTVADFFRLLILTGSRKSEILGAQWEWVDWTSGALRLPDSKTGETVRYLSSPALKILHRLGRGDEGPIFTINDRTIYNDWYRVLKAAKIDDLKLHDLRHHFASVAVSGGMDLYMVGRLLGHTSLASTQRYAHLMVDPQRQAVDTIAESFDLGDDAEPLEAEVIEFRR